MKKLLVFTIWVAALLVAHSTISAYPNHTYVSIKAGVIRNFFPNDYPFDYDKYAFYPELQMGGSLISSNLFRWTFYLGYFDDGVVEPFPIADGITYSYDSIILGTRLGFMPGAHRKELPLQPEVFVGLARHFIGADYVGGSDFAGNRGQDFDLGITYFEIGLNANLKITGSLQATFEVQQSMELTKNNFGFPDNRRAFKVGLIHLF